jgi:hypothetical protein
LIRGEIHAGIVVAQVAPGQVFLKALSFYPVSIIPLLHDTHSYLPTIEDMLSEQLTWSLNQNQTLAILMTGC